jgi:hypothetical protein
VHLERLLVVLLVRERGGMDEMGVDGVWILCGGKWDGRVGWRRGRGVVDVR